VRFRLRVWRQENASASGRFERYEVDDVRPDVSFLEMLDLANEQLAERGLAPIEFDYDCAEILIEPWRAGAFPVIRDLVVDRGALDRIIAAGGYVSLKSGAAPDANAILIPKEEAELAFDAGQCIGCGACVAACPNSSAMLFVAAKAAHLAHLPQGAPERLKRAVSMVEEHDREGFGSCSNHYRCESACPKEISVRYIAELNRDFLRAALTTDQLSKLPPRLEDEE
jgi:succinate dehydrogenase / fumarate reductase iron-sulfur subunit